MKNLVEPQLRTLPSSISTRNESKSWADQNLRRNLVKQLVNFQFFALIRFDEIYLSFILGYWIHRDQRVQDNWAALYAQKLALQNGKPLHFAGALASPGPNDAGNTARVYDFSLKGHKEVASECQKLNIEYHLLEDDKVIFDKTRRFEVA